MIGLVCPPTCRPASLRREAISGTEKPRGCRSVSACITSPSFMLEPEVHEGRELMMMTITRTSLSANALTTHFVLTPPFRPMR
jgi:hypothetical protein